MPTIRKRGTRWQVQVRIKRDGAIVFQDSASFDTRKQAEVWGRSLESRIETEGSTAFLQGKETVSSLIKSWLDAKGTSSRGTQHSASEILKAPFARSSIKALTAKQLVDWVGSMATAPATRLHHVMTLRAAMVSSLSLLGVPPNLSPIVDAMAHLQRMKVTGKSIARTRRVTDAELDLVVAHLRAKELMVPTDVFIRLAIALPRRREELLTMRWDDYDPDAGTLILRDTKNPNVRRDETLPVPPQAQAIINKLDKFHELILPYKPESVSAAFQRAVRAVGLEDLRLHDLRHEGISRLFEQGLQIQEVATISGHVSWAALRRYTHIKPSSVLEKLNAHIQRAQKNPAQPA